MILRHSLQCGPPLVVAVQFIAACEKKPEFLKSETEKAADMATPLPATPAGTPKPNWMWKDYKNPLDPSKKRK